MTRSLRGGLRVRPLAFSAVAMISVLGALAIAFYVFEVAGEEIFLARERAAAMAERDVLLEDFRVEGMPRLVVGVDRRARHAAPGEIYGLFDAAGRRLAGNVPRRPVGAEPAGWAAGAVPGASGPIPVHYSATALPGGATLMVGRDDRAALDHRRKIRDGFLVGMAIVIATSLGVGLALNMLVARRARSVADVAQRIAAGDLAARADVSPRGDSFDRIGVALNHMLDRMEALITGMRTVTDSLTHDLRTPLTRMRSAIEDVTDSASDADACRGALEAVRNEVDGVLSVLSALTDIARAEAGLSQELMQSVELQDLVRDMEELFAPVLEDAGQTLEFAQGPAITVEGHDGLLRQAVGNLLFNAARHAGPGARVRLEVVAGDEVAEIIVADTGPGIPEAAVARVTERFVRLDEARTRGGSGLGLAIVAAAAKLHHGELRLEDNRPGLRAVLRLARTIR